MRRRAFAVVWIGLVVMSLLAVSATAGGSAPVRSFSRPSNALLIAAARASAPRLFSIFPHVLGTKKQCVLAAGWGAGRYVHGSCSTGLAFVHTPSGPEAHVSFAEVWPRGRQTWTIIEFWGTRASLTGKVKVIDTSWRGDLAGQLGR